MESEYNKTVETIGLLYLTTLLDDMWRGFKRFFWLLFVFSGICAAAFYVNAARSYSPSYTAYASFVIQAQTPYGYSEKYFNKTVAAQMSKTFPYILTSGALEQVVLKDMGLETLPAVITAQATADTALFTLKVTSSEPQVSYDVLQSVIKNYPEVAEPIIGTTHLTQMDESGVPKTPSNPKNFVRKAEKGGIIGAGVFVLFLLLYAMERRTVRREEDLKKRFSFPMLGNIPMIRYKSRSKISKTHALLTDKGVSAKLGEPVRWIRVRLLKETENNHMCCLMVTSAAAGEGKTTTTVNLALSMAVKGLKVVLIDGDLRNPSVASSLGVSGTYGISHLLENKVEIKDVLKIVNGDGLMVIPGVEPVKNPTELLSSEHMHTLISKLKGLADYIIIDAPPCTVVSDACVLARWVDGLVMVVRQDFARIEKVTSGFEILVETGTPFVGYILNGTEMGITGYGHGYGHGYGYGYGKYGYGKYGDGKYGYGKYGYSKYNDGDNGRDPQKKGGGHKADQKNCCE